MAENGPLNGIITKITVYEARLRDNMTVADNGEWCVEMACSLV